MDIGILKRGAIAGLVGATVLAVWFLASDLIAGEPLATPGFVASALLGGAGAAAIPAYTVIHYMSFVVVGLATAWAMDRVPVAAPTLLGLALGFLLFDLVFYGSVMATGADIVAEVGWPPVLIGNVVAGLSITHTIHRSQAAGGRAWLRDVLRGPVVREGAWVGLAGAAAVALWFLLLDVLAGRPLQTPSALGGLLFAGDTAAATAPVSVAWVVGYSLVHLALFMGLGAILSALSSRVESAPMLFLGTVLGFVSLEALALAMVAVLAEFLPHAWWTFVGANLLAAVAMGAVLLRAHPTLVAALGSDDFATAD